MELTWQNSLLITGEVPAELRRLKKRNGDDLWVHGSGNLIQTLLANDLVDALHVWICPMTTSKGKRLFGEGTKPRGLKLVDSKTSTSGVIISVIL